MYGPANVKVCIEHFYRMVTRSKLAVEQDIKILTLTFNHLLDIDSTGYILHLCAVLNLND